MQLGMRMELFVEDVATSVAFYTNVLGFVAGEQDDAYMDVTNGSVMLGICKRSELAPDHYFDQASFAGRKGVGVEVVLEAGEHLDALYQHVLETGYPVREPMVTRPWGSRDFRVVDPDGYYLRITG